MRLKRSAPWSAYWRMISSSAWNRTSSGTTASTSTTGVVVISHSASLGLNDLTCDTIRRQAARLYRSALGMTRNATDAEDLVQETFAKALAASGRLQPGANLAAWLHRIMFNAFVTDYHKRRREPLLAMDPADGEANLPWLWGPADGRSAEEQALDRLLEADIVAAIRVLPYSYRIMVYLADVKGLDYRQVADLTGVSIGTVKSSLHRGRSQLRARLANTLRQDAALPVVRRRAACVSGGGVLVFVLHR
jgi:RNA polymerase sigma-70 factor, ECF subfamily